MSKLQITKKQISKGIHLGLWHTDLGDEGYINCMRLIKLYKE